MTAQRSARPLIIMLATLLLFLGGTAALQQASPSLKGATDAVRLHPIQGEKTLLLCDHATQALTDHDDTTARRLLGEISRQPLIAYNGGMGTGPLQAFAPSSLIMRLGKALAARAQSDASQGQSEQAGEWLRACHDLSGQTLRGPAPTLDALTLARYLDTTADHAQIAVYRTLHERDKAQQAQARESAIARQWHERIIGPLMQAQTRDKGDAGDSIAAQSNANFMTVLIGQYQALRADVY